MPEVDINTLEVINTCHNDLMELYDNINIVLDKLYHLCSSLENLDFHIDYYYKNKHPELYDVIKERLENRTLNHTHVISFIITNASNDSDTQSDNNDDDHIGSFYDIEDYMLTNNTRPINRFNLTNISSVLEELVQRYIPNNFEEPVKVTLTKDSLNKIPLIKYAEIKEKTKHTTCFICLENFEGIDDVRHLFCDHIYHSFCIDTWLKNYNYKCPICRSEVGEHQVHIDE